MKFYVVKKGRIPGIYGSWSLCETQVKEFKGAVFKSFGTIDEANSWYQDIPMSIVGQVYTIYADGGCNKHTNGSAWGSVVDSTGTDLIGAHARNTILQDMPLIEANLPGGKRVVIVAIFNDVSTQQNNGAELMALVAAMRIALCINCKVVASDSELLVSWWSKRLDTKKIGLMDPRKVQYVNELILLRKELEIRGGQLLKISGDNNPADLGYHK